MMERLAWIACGEVAGRRGTYVVVDLAIVVMFDRGDVVVGGVIVDLKKLFVPLLLLFSEKWGEV